MKLWTIDLLHGVADVRLYSPFNLGPLRLRQFAAELNEAADILQDPQRAAAEAGLATTMAAVRKGAEQRSAGLDSIAEDDAGRDGLMSIISAMEKRIEGGGASPWWLAVTVLRRLVQRIRLAQIDHSDGKKATDARFAVLEAQVGAVNDRLDALGEEGRKVRAFFDTTNRDIIRIGDQLAQLAKSTGDTIIHQAGAIAAQGEKTEALADLFRQVDERLRDIEKPLGMENVRARMGHPESPYSVWRRLDAVERAVDQHAELLDEKGGTTLDELRGSLAKWTDEERASLRQALNDLANGIDADLDALYRAEKDAGEGGGDAKGGATFDDLKAEIARAKSERRTKDDLLLARYAEAQIKNPGSVVFETPRKNDSLERLETELAREAEERKDAKPSA